MEMLSGVIYATEHIGSPYHFWNILDVILIRKYKSEMYNSLCSH